MLLRAMLVPLAIIAALPASAQVSTRGLSASEATELAARTCGVPPTFISVTKNLDGSSSFQVSPSLSRAQVSCVEGTLMGMGIYLRK